MNDSLRPAGGADAGVADRLAAGRAELRQRHVDDQAEGRAQRAGDAAQSRRSRVGGGEARVHARNASAVAVLPQRGHDRHGRMDARAPSSSTEDFCARGGGVPSACGASDFLIERVADDIAERLAVVLRQFDLAVDLGTAGRRGAARAGGERQGRHDCCGRRRRRRRPARSRSSPTRRRCRSATARSISWCRRCRCNSPTTCRACWCRSGARCGRTACCSRRCSAATR